MQPMPTPVIPMPTLSTIVRGSVEECTDVFDSTPNVNSLTEVVQTPLGLYAFTCKKSKSGDITVSIKKMK